VPPCREREREREMVKVVKRKKKEKRGQPPLSDFGNPPLEEKQQRKRTRQGPWVLILCGYPAT
jgi:hypothetical protein